MRAYMEKTDTEVNRRKEEGGVKSHGVNDILAWRKPIQGTPYTASHSKAERRTDENKDLDMSETFSASDAPELVVFIQESDYQSIKDIFIDREVPSRSRLKYNDIHSKYHTDVNGDKEPGRSLKIMSSISNEIEQDFQKFVRKRHALENLIKNDEEDIDGRDDRLHDESVGKMTSGMWHEKEFQIGNSVTLKPMEPLATAKIDDNSHLSEVSSHSEAESESTVHLSDSSLTTMSSPEEFIQGLECQQPRKAKTLSRTEDRMSRSLRGPSQNVVNEIAHGDSASCAVSPLSGPIPCSGSISLRSSSSTASSHSFAFPILPSEWNGSPVRMAEADPSQARKHQSWRTCFLCM